MNLARRCALFAGLLFAPSILISSKSPLSFGSSPEVIVFRWQPGATVHNCAQVEERTELTCSHIDWIRDGKNKRRWTAVCQ